jgi:EpsI family protein
MRSKLFATTVALLVGTALLLGIRGDHDVVPASTPLDHFPYEIGNWQGVDQRLETYVFGVLGNGFFLNRSYSLTDPATMAGEPKPFTAPIGLFIAYFPTQRTGQAIHSPMNCLPGAGWTFDSHGVSALEDSSGKHASVGDYVISNGSSRDEVLYWYRSQGRTIASDYKAKYYNLVDSILHGRTDAALVRVITPIEPGEKRADAQHRALQFASQMNPLLSAYIPD